MTKEQHADLERAFNDCVARYGRGHAIDVISAAAGTYYWFEVPDDKIAAAMAALTGGITVARSGGKMVAKGSPGDRLKAIHSTLNAMAATVFARRRNANS